MARQLSWKPVRRGRVYCSTACGSGCTRAAYDSAVKAARKLARRLGKGWKTRVWENMGWHHEVLDRTECIKVHPFYWRGRIHSYTAYLGEPGMGGRWVESSSTPEKAIKMVRKSALTSLDDMEKMVSVIKSVKVGLKEGDA